MSAPDTPKHSGLHRRYGRPFSELSTFHICVAFVIVLLSFAAFLAIALQMMGAH